MCSWCSGGCGLKAGVVPIVLWPAQGEGECLWRAALRGGRLRRFRDNIRLPLPAQPANVTLQQKQKQGWKLHFNKKEQMNVIKIKF